MTVRFNESFRKNPLLDDDENNTADNSMVDKFRNPIVNKLPSDLKNPIDPGYYRQPIKQPIDKVPRLPVKHPKNPIDPGYYRQPIKPPSGGVDKMPRLQPIKNNTLPVEDDKNKMARDRMARAAALQSILKK